MISDNPKKNPNLKSRKKQKKRYIEFLSFFFKEFHKSQIFSFQNIYTCQEFPHAMPQLSAFVLSIPN